MLAGMIARQGTAFTPPRADPDRRRTCPPWHRHSCGSRPASVGSPKTACPPRWAAALRDNGGGQLITSEFEPSKVARARDNLIAGGLIDLVEIRQGDALQTLAVDLPDQVDLLLDGAKALYGEVLDRRDSGIGRKVVCEPALSSSPTTPTTTRTTRPACAHRAAATCRSRSARTWS